MNAQPSHWSRHARQWSLIGQPLRPVPQDIRLLEQTLADRRERSAVTAPGTAVCAEWLALPLADASQHLLIGDGCNSRFTGSARYAALVTRVPTYELGECCPTLFLQPV